MLPLQFLLIFLFLSFASSFNCDTVDKEKFCTVMEGCKWEENACKGDFEPNCDDSDCKYIYPSSTASDPDGSIKSPYKSLS